MEPGEFLRSHPPFDRLSAEAFRSLERNLEIEYVTGGTLVLRRGGERSRHLYVVRKGSVRLERDGQVVQQLEEGDSFGFPSLIARASPHLDVVAAEDSLLYRVPEELFERLMAQPGFADFYLADLSARLRQTAALEPLPLGPGLGTPASSLALQAPLRVSPQASVREAARLMRDARASCVLVEVSPVGILTDRDLRGRVLAEGRGPETPVCEVMTQPALTVPAASSLFEVLVFMLEHGVHHAPLTRGDEVVGLLSDTDLLRLQVKSPLSVLRALERLDQPEALRGYAPEVAGMVELLAWGGLEATQIGRVVSRLNDALVGRLLRRAEAELGPPPTSYAWIVFGSEGRLEQALLTDQDNALVYREASPEAGRYFAALAERVVADLIAAQFPPCRGGFMATRWCHPLDEWLRLFRGWVQAPQPRALIEAANFFDFRRVHGELELEPLQQVLAEAAREQIFLAHLARAALGFTPPLGLFRHIRQEDGGVDLKKGGLIPIVSLARLHALECGSRARPTVERLEAAAAGGTLSREGAATLAEAFRFLLRLRLRAQLQALRAGQAPDNRVRLDELSSLERRHLKETFVTLGEMQQATALRYAVERLG